MKQKQQRSATLDLTHLTTEAELCRGLQQALDLGKGEEATWEALREAWNRQLLSRRLELRGWRTFQQSCPEVAQRFLEEMDGYNRLHRGTPCQLVFGDGLSPALFWGPDIFLFALLPVEVLSLIAIVGRFGWKMAVIALFVAIALVTQVIVVTCVLSVMQPRWPVTCRHRWLAVIRAALSLLLFAGSAVGLALAASSGIHPQDGFALCAAGLALAANAGYPLVLLRKGR